MNYKSNKIQDQKLMFHIEMEHKGQNITFNVVCAESESEIPELINQYLEMLDNPPKVEAQTTPQIDPMTLVKEQQAIIDDLKARLDAAGI